MKKIWNRILKAFAIHNVSGSIWLLYRIEAGELKTYTMR